MSDSVLTAMEAAVAANPEDVDLRLHLAQLYFDADRFADAGRQAAAVLELHDLHRSALVLAIASLRALGDTSHADAYQLTLDRLDRGDADAQDTGAGEAGASAGDSGAGLAAVEVPDTADELMDSWADVAAPEGVEVGELLKPRVSLDDVGGLEHVKQQLDRSFLGPIRNPEMAAKFGMSASGGLLLWGPPGCGKTFLARATAGEMGANFYNVGLSDVLEMYIGSSERNLSAIFETARRNAPCVLFFDEIDAIGQKRSLLRYAGAALRGVVNVLLAELDGATSDNDGLYVLAATNHPWDVDEALLRPGRFDRRLLVLPPDPPARLAILEYHLRDKPQLDLDLRKLVAATDGYSGADLAFIVTSATETALDESLRTGDLVPITDRRLADALDTIKPSIGPWLETARNHVVYSNRSGDYDELEAYMNRRR